jgi:protein TonB
LPPDQTSVPAEILPALPPEARPSLAEQLEAMPPEAPLAPAEALASKQVGPPPQIAAEAAPATVAEEIRLAAASVIEPAIEPGPSLANAPAPLTSPHILNPVHAVSRFGTSFVSQMPIKPPGIKKAGPAEGFKPAAPVANGQPTVEEHNLGYSGLPGEVEVQQATGAAVEAQSGEALPPPVAIAVKPEYPENPIIRAPEFPQASLAPFPENLPEAMPSPEMTPTPPMLKPAISPEALPEPESRWPPAMAQEADATPAISPLPVLANAPAPEPEPALAPVPLRSEASAAETIPTEPIAAIKAATADEVLARLSSLIATQKTYPEAARRRNSEGVVKIGVIIRSDGSLKSSKLVARSGSAVLDRAASDLLKELFPITFNLADEMEVVVTISYKLSR